MDHAVVLAGGSGTRFWPESRIRRSKQFLDLTGEGPMIAATLRRLRPLFPRKNLWVVAGEKDAPHLVPARLGIPEENLLLEPAGRNTAPAVALAALHVCRRDPEAVVVAAPADHAVADGAGFREVLAKGLALAGQTGRFVTLGIPPTRPATGYGYIERGRPFRDGAYRVRRFTEKPDAATARRFLRTGRFSWNSGLFLVRARLLLERTERYLPEVWRELSSAFRAVGRRGYRKALAGAYRRIPAVSVDYGILEKEPGILVLPAEFGWNDLGTWDSLREFLARGEKNVTFGDVILRDCTGSLVRSDRGVVACVGMDGVVVVRCGDAVLVCPRGRSEEVKGIAEEVRRRFPRLS